MESSSSSRAPTRSRWNPRVEINHYLDTPFADTELDFADGNDVNLLLWWKNHQRIYPVLSHFARDVLVVLPPQEEVDIIAIREVKLSVRKRCVEVVVDLYSWIPLRPGRRTRR